MFLAEYFTEIVPDYLCRSLVKSVAPWKEEETME